MSETKLDNLYNQARAALGKKDYTKATELLKRILVLDENYKDASRLLAQTVELKRRRWYNDARIWGPAISIVAIGLLIWLVPKLSLPTMFAPMPTATITTSPTVTIAPTRTAIPTRTPIPTKTHIPLSWQRISMGQDFSRDIITAALMDPSDPDIYYISTNYSGNYKSIDGGLSWQHFVNPEIDLKLTILTAYSQAEQQQTQISTSDGKSYRYRLEGGGFGFPYSKLYTSKDNGATWQLSDVRGCSSIAYISHELVYIFCLGSLYQLPSWKLIGKLPVEYASAIAVSPHNGNVFLVGSDTGLFISSNHGISWLNLTSSIGSTWLELKISPTGTLFIQDGPTMLNPKSSRMGMGNDCNLFRSSDRGYTWELVVRIFAKIQEWPVHGCGLSFGSDGTILYWNKEIGGVIKSSDNGNNWSAWGGDFYVDGVHHFLGIVTPHPRNPDIFFAFENNQLFATLDGRKNWFVPVAFKDYENGPFVKPKLYFDGLHGSTLYLVHDEGVYKSTDYGKYWEPCYQVPMPANSDTQLVVDPRDSNRIFIATSAYGIYSSQDGCQSWERRNSGLGNLYVNTIAIDPNNPDTLYAGTDGGAYVSFDGGQTWNQINDGLLGATVIYSIVVDKDSDVYATTPYGVFKLAGK